jgi:hypothetical protein
MLVQLLLFSLSSLPFKKFQTVPNLLLWDQTASITDHSGVLKLLEPFPIKLASGISSDLFKNVSA